MVKRWKRLLFFPPARSTVDCIIFTGTMIRILTGASRGKRNEMPGEKKQSGSHEGGRRKSGRSRQSGSLGSEVFPTGVMATNYHSFSRTAGQESFSVSDANSESLRSQQENLLQETRYRGFSSSIFDMFQHPDQERIDCCAITCCGILQSDRDRYLVTGITPPGSLKRIVVHIIIPLTIFVMAGVGAIQIQNAYLRQVTSYALVLTIISLIFLQCFKGRSKRIEVRKDLLFTKYQIQSNRHRNRSLSVLLELERPDDDDAEENPVYFMGQMEEDFGRAHPCCLLSLYLDDRLEAQNDLVADANLASCIWKFLSPTFCGWNVQCCGVCALAQEGRELERAVLPRAYSRIDYITMQPYMEYYPAIYNAKFDVSRSEYFPSCTLSKLSIQILQWAVIFFIISLAWAILSPIYWNRVAQSQMRSATFDLKNFCVLVGTFLEPIGVLILLVNLCNRRKPTELSLDAMIKYFAAGFCLATTLAVFWEMVLAIILKTCMMIGFSLSGINPVKDPEKASSILLFPGALIPHHYLIQADSVQDFMQATSKSHPILYTLYIVLISFVLASFVEEVCKYFTYRMVDHPDFLSRKELMEADRVFREGTDSENRTSGNIDSDFSRQQESYQSRGAAVTLAMIAVAMGFTCCENLVYVFIYSGSSIKMKLSVLVARSMFPVHPIAAALQSLGAVERDVEKNGSARLGRRILFPAVLFHGSYDFFILWMDYLATRNGADKADVKNIYTFAVSIIIIFTALTYFSVLAGRQRQRLAAMDRNASVDRSRLI